MNPDDPVTIEIFELLKELLVATSEIKARIDFVGQDVEGLRAEVVILARSTEMAAMALVGDDDAPVTVH
jgi:hypothetical protein